jgi:hypothetical protein
LAALKWFDMVTPLDSKGRGASCEEIRVAVGARLLDQLAAVVVLQGARAGRP